MTNKEKNWQVKAQRKQLMLSASQFDTADRCLRRWWFEKVRRLQPGYRGHLIFGSVLHSVAERWFSADEKGYGSDGKPVDLYPDGWTVSWGKYPDADGKIPKEGEVTQAEARHIRKLCDQAAENGTWQRGPGRKVEAKFTAPLTKIDGIAVSVTGAVDVLYPDVVEDHKTTKSKRWAVGREALRTKQPMLTYANFCADTENGVMLRYNYFCKDLSSPMEPWPVEALASRSDIKANLEKIVDLSANMARVRRDIVDWQEVPCNEEACSDFGGCPFQRVCSKSITIDTFAAGLQKSQKTAPKPTGGDMPTLQELMAKRKAQAPTTTASKADAPKEDAKPSAPAKSQDVPEWAQADCKACGGTGFNSKGAPCRICEMNYAKQAKAEPKPEPEPNTWLLLADVNGELVGWYTEEEAAETLENTSGAVGAVSDVVDSCVSVDRPDINVAIEAKQEAEKPAKQEAEKPAKREKKAEKPAKQEAEKPAKREKKAEKPVRGKSKPTLYVGCIPSGKPYSTCSDVLRQVSEILGGEDAQEDPLGWFYGLDPFARRDVLQTKTGGLVDELPRHIVWLSVTPDHNALLDALRPHCNEVRAVSR